jgi:hypothetical protein
MTWKRAILGIALILLAPVAGGQDPDGTIDYRVERVKRKLLRELADGSERLREGANLRSGDALRTGWLSQADIDAPSYAARFHLSSSTRVRLAHQTPGVLLELEKGRLRAIFDKLLGEEPPERLVISPSAILAVRGTEYGATVDGSGTTTVVVFSGMVEVQDRDRLAAPIQVQAGFYTTVRREQKPGSPQPHQMQGRDWDRGRMPDSMGRGSQSGSRGNPGAGSSSGSSMGNRPRSSGHGGSRHGGTGP